jgi:hypothetical protein
MGDLDLMITLSMHHRSETALPIHQFVSLQLKPMNSAQSIRLTFKMIRLLLLIAGGSYQKINSAQKHNT